MCELCSKQAFVRSSLAQGLLRRPGARLPSMFGGLAGGPGSVTWGAPAMQEWMVTDPAINQWLAQFSESTKQNLTRTPFDLRCKVSASVYSRTLSPNAPQNAEAYLNGALQC